MKVTTRKGKAFLKLDGELTVARAADFKSALANSLEKAENVEVNLAEISSIDLACLQLLCSAHRSAVKEGKTFTLKDPSIQLFKDACSDAGFVYSKPCRYVDTDDCLWVGGNK